MNQPIHLHVRFSGLFLATLPLLSGCASLGSRPSTECQIAPPDILESHRETALKVAADLSKLVAAPIKADFEATFKDKATRAFRAIPDASVTCHMFLQAINCILARPNSTTIANRLSDYLPNACDVEATLLTPQQHRLLGLIHEHQKAYGATKVVIARDGELKFTEPGQRAINGVNLAIELLGEGDKAALAREFEILMEAMPSQYLHKFYETRWDSPFVVTITEAGVSYLEGKNISQVE